MKDDLERNKADNERIQRRIEDERVDVNNVEGKLTSTNATRKNLEFDNDNMNSDL